MTRNAWRNTRSVRRYSGICWYAMAAVCEIWAW